MCQNWQAANQLRTDHFTGYFLSVFLKNNDQVITWYIICKENKLRWLDNVGQGFIVQHVSTRDRLYIRWGDKNVRITHYSVYSESMWVMQINIWILLINKMAKFLPIFSIKNLHDTYNMLMKEFSSFVGQIILSIYSTHIVILWIVKTPWKISFCEWWLQVTSLSESIIVSFMWKYQGNVSSKESCKMW